MIEATLNIAQLIQLAAIIHGLILSALLLRRRSVNQANVFLALFLFSICWSLIGSFFVTFGVYDRYPLLVWFPFSLSFLFGPSLYFYIKFLTLPNTQFRWKDSIHFSPVILNYAHSLFHIILGRNDGSPRLHNFIESLEIYATISMIIYFILGFLIVRKYQKEIFHQLSDLESMNLRWIQELIKVTAVSLSIVLVFIIVDIRLLFDFEMEFSDGTLFQYDDLLKVLYSGIIYWVSIKGYFQKAYVPAFTSMAGEEKFGVSSPDELNETISVLKRSMEVDSLYLNASLDLRTLEKHTKIPARDLSAAINKGLDKNFYFFINEYRVEEAKKRLKDPNYTHYSILAIAYDSGFNSKATFNRVFKESTGFSPSQFRQSP